MMRSISAAAVAALMLAGVSNAASAAGAKIEAAAKTFGGVEADAGKLAAFCEMFKLMTTAEGEQDEKKAQALEGEIDAKMKSLGEEFTAAWDLQAELDADSDDGKAYYAAADKLMGKCPK